MVTTMLSLLHNWATLSPDSDFLSEDMDSSLSYGQAYILATELIPAQLNSIFPSRRLSTVVILSPNSTLLPLLSLSLWSMQIRVVPLSTAAEPYLWAGMVQHVQPCAVFVCPTLIEPMRRALEQFGLDSQIPTLVSIVDIIPPTFANHGSSVRHRASDYIPALSRWLQTRTPLLVANAATPPPHSDCDALTLFTSSAVDWSTLKSVTYTHSVLLHSSRRAMTMLGGDSYSSSPKRHLGWLPLSHCFEFCITLCGIILGTGGCYVFYDRCVSSPDLQPSTPLPQLLLYALEYYGDISSFTTIPAIFGEMIPFCTQGDLTLLKKLHSLGVGGARTAETIFQWAATQNIAYFDCSGATEAAGTICIRRTADRYQREHGLEVIDGLSGFLEKRDASDNFGELILQGTHLPVGYDNRESEVFSFDAITGVTTYRTGDLYGHQSTNTVRSLVKGIDEALPPYSPKNASLSGLTYIGRNDDMVVLATGVKIDALSIERYIDTVPGVLRSGVLASARGDTLVALIQPKPDSSGDFVSSILEFNTTLPLEKRIPSKNIFLVGELPVTTKLTLNRKKLKHILSAISSDNDIPSILPPPNWITTTQSSSTISHSDDHKTLLAEILSSVFSIPSERFMHSGTPFSDIPLASISAVKLAQSLQTHFAVKITAAQLYAIRDVNALWVLLGLEEATSSLGVSPAAIPSMMGADSVAEPSQSNGEAVVISGASCRFVGGIDSLDTFWSALISPNSFLDGLSRERPASRWPKTAEESNYFPSGWLDASVTANTSSFSEFFGLLPKETAAMSPNSRLCLQLGYQAIEDAGIAPHSLNGRNWAVFTSLNDSGWRERRVLQEDLHSYSHSLHGSADDAAGARLSYFLNLTGPALEVKTACSSSAVAIHQARLAIANGDCEAAIVIASTTHYHPSGAIFRATTGITSPRGRCEPFYQTADGFVASEGAAAIVIQKEVDAKVVPYARLRMTVVTQDGASRGFFAPNEVAQHRLLKRTLESSSCAADEISFLEAHGTGTVLGDAIELRSVTEIFGGNRQMLYVGSCKAVIGHTEECAGLASVLKILLCLKHNTIPPQPAAGPLNESLDLSFSAATLPVEPVPFTAEPRLCLVSSFGLSGTLASVLIQSIADSPDYESFTDGSHVFEVFIITGRSPADLVTMVNNYTLFLRHQHLRTKMLHSFCRTSQIARTHFSVRYAWAVTSWMDLLDRLKDVSRNEPKPTSRPPSIGIWFGLIAHASGQKVDTTHARPVLRAALDKYVGAGWLTMYDGYKRQLALADTLSSLGCQISVVGGEGAGEYLAAIFAKVLSTHNAFKLRDGTDSTRSVTVAIRATEDAVKRLSIQWMPDECSLVGYHGFDLWSVRCGLEALQTIKDTGDIDVVGMSVEPTIFVPTTPVPSHFPRKIKIISGHLCEVLQEESLNNPDYWFGVQDRFFNTQDALTSMENQCDVVVRLGDFFGPDELRPGRCVGGSLEEILAALFQRGCDVDWENFAEADTHLPRIHLPPYSWSQDT